MTTARCARRGGRGSRATRWTWPPTPCPSCCTSAWPNRARTIPFCSRTTCWRRWARATKRASRCTAPSTTSTPTSTASTPTASRPWPASPEHASGRHRGTGVRGQDAGPEGDQHRRRREAAHQGHRPQVSGRSVPGDRPPRQLCRLLRHRQRIRLRPVLGQGGRAGRARHHALRQPGLDRPAIHQQLHVQSHRPLRRRLAGLRQGAVLRRRDAPLPEPARGLAGRRRRLGLARLHASGRPLGKAQPQGGAELQPGPRRPRAAAGSVLALRRGFHPWPRTGPGAAAARQPGHLCPAAQPRAARGRAGRFRRRRHRVGRGHPQALGGQLLLRLRGRRPHRGGRLQRPRPSAGREDQRDLVLRHRPLGRARPDRAAGRKLGPGRTGRHQRAGLQGPGVRQSLPPLHRGQSRFLPGHGDRAQARRPPAATDTKTRAA